MPRPQLAKLSRPKLYDAVVRERLFRRLDTNREHPVVWVAGPPGSGKTTLVASYIEATSLPAIWYLLDKGDSDPATFFDYLSQAARASSRRSDRGLPLLTEEYLSDLEGFARRFVRDLFARVTPGSLLVLDNYHEIAIGSPLHSMLNAAFAEVPRNANVVVISRTQPPAVFARARVSGTIEPLEWEELRLDEEETAAIVARRGMLDSAVVSAIHAQAGGWVAGVRLLLERADAIGKVRLDTSGALEPAFDYFATEIFDAAPESLRSLLLRTAFLPRFTAAMASAISGDLRAESHLDDLYKRRLFLNRRAGEDGTYQYHDLFRAFLRSRVMNGLPAEDVTALIRESATLLAATNLMEDAFLLFVEAPDWPGAEDIFLRNAKLLISRGRWRTVEEWSAMLPGKRLDTNPWLRYWLGRSKALVEPVEGIEILKATYSGFQLLHDSRGMLFSASAVLETLHFTVHQWNEMERWLERLVSALGTQHESLAPDDELQIHASLFWAAENSIPGSAAIAASAQKVMQLLPACTDVNLRVSAANMLNYLAVHTLDQQFTQVAAREARPYLASPDLSADRHALYYLSEGMAHVDPGRIDQALECYDRAEAIIERYGLGNRRRLAKIWRALCHAAAGHTDEARTCIEALEQLPGADPALIEQCFLTAQALAYTLLGQPEKALARIRQARISCDRFGPINQYGFILPDEVYIMIASGQAAQADEPLAAVRKYPGVVQSMCFASSVALMEAWRAFRLENDEACREALRRTLELSRHDGERWRLRWFHLALSELLPLALAQSIEPELARALIKESRLVPPVDASDAWPWPVKIYALGRFEVLVDDSPLEFGRKAPKRTIGLLKALIAMGGKDIAEQRLADALWPDLEGDAGLESLAAALHRLRRLLGGNEAIRQSNGTLTLNNRHCFVDAWAFELRAEQNDATGLRLYRGAFLDGDGDAPWAASMRERLRTKFVRGVEAVGSKLESAGRYEEAIALYSRGIETDNLVEPFYRGLMRCYHSLERLAEAASAFRSLRQTLSITLGVKPSAETQNLLQRLRLQ